MRRVWTAVLVGVALSVSAGCSTLVGNGAQAPAAQTAAKDANEADVRFSQNMIPHHRLSLEMAQLASEKGTSALVKDTAADIAKAETEEVNVMSGYLQSWGAKVPEGTAMSGHAMKGMVSDADIALLKGVSGAEFDSMWSGAMAKHLRVGVDMAKTVLTAGQHTPTMTLAGRIVAGMEARITALENQS